LYVYYDNDRLVFKISLPLVYQHTLTLFHLIPKPVCESNNCIFIKPSYKFLAVSRSKDLYSIYDNFKQTNFKRSRDFLLCPEIHLLHPRSGKPIYEILLLQDPKEVPENCSLLHVRIATSVLHRLKFKNEWLYTTESETLFVTCDEDKQSTSHTIKGVGKILLNETCKAYVTQDILIPGRVHNQKEYQDLIPGSVIPDLDKRLSLTVIGDIMRNKHVVDGEMGDLVQVATTSEQLESGNRIRQLEQG
jgi:hypothetical protein